MIGIINYSIYVKSKRNAPKKEKASRGAMAFCVWFCTVGLGMTCS